VVAHRTGALFVESAGDLCRLTIKFSDPDVSSIGHVSVSQRPGEGGLNFTMDGTAVIVPRAPKGKYWLSCSLWKPSTQWMNVVTQLEVTGSPEQTILVDTTTHSLSVSVEGLKDTPLNQIHVGVYLFDDAGLATIQVAWAKCDNAGKVAFPAIPAGDYQLRAWIGRAPESVVHAAAQQVSITEETSAILQLNESAGALRIRFAPWSPPSGSQLHATRVEFLDEHGGPIAVADPVHATFATTWEHTVPSVPAGKWTVRVTRPGMLPFTKTVNIESGKVTDLAVEPEQARCPRIIVERFMQVGAGPPEFTWTCRDADGNQLEVELPNNNTGVAFYEKEGLLLILFNLPEAATHVTLKVKGFEPAEVEIIDGRFHFDRNRVTLEPKRPGSGD
jgi:hypothetical protein